MRTLIIEDIPAIAQSTREILLRLDDALDVDIASTLHDACGLLENGGGYDVAIVDLNLPDASGLEAPASIRELCPDTVIVVLTGEQSSGLARQLVREGVQEYIPKIEATPERLLRSIYVAIERLERETHLKRTASFDALTGTLNRRGMIAALQTSLASVQRLDANAALCVIDVDRFKPINDRYGHPAGDAVLREFARRLCDVTRANDQVGRIGGDEFWVLLDDITDIARCGKAAEKLQVALARPQLIGKELVTVQASIGVAIAPRDASTIDDWIGQADEALYAAKRDGRGCWKMYADIKESIGCLTGTKKMN